MKCDVLWTVVAVAVGTFLMRYLPIVWGGKEQQNAGSGPGLANGVAAAVIICLALHGLGLQDARGLVGLLPTVAGALLAVLAQVFWRKFLLSVALGIGGWAVARLVADMLSNA